MMKFFLCVLLTTSILGSTNLVAESNAPISVQRTKDCPLGSELIGKQCVTTEVFQPNLVCPPGTTLLKGECASFSRANRACLNGLTLSGDHCVNTEVISASFVCDQGDVVGKQCRITNEIPPMCPAGLQLLNGQCVRFTVQQTICAPGYELQDKQCSKQISSPASPVCPSNFSLTGNDQCSKSIPVSPRCKPGFSLVKNECIKQVAQVAAPCPQGFSSTGNECQRSQQFPVRLACPYDFILGSNGQCAQEIPVAPTCPSGTSRGTSGQCERSIAKVPVCDSEEELVSGRCKRTSLFSSELRCADGYSLIHEKCKKVVNRSPVPRCSSGVLRDNQCITESPSVPLLQCPAGYQLAKGPKCVRDVSYDCPRTVVKTECEMPAFVAEISTLRGLHSDYKAKVAPAFDAKSPAAQFTESKAPKCSPVKRVIPETCTKAEAVPVEYVCADGSAPRGKNCSVVTSSPTEFYCAAGQLNKATGQCVTIDIQPSQRVCAVGQLQHDGNCVHVGEKPATMICADGSEAMGGKDAGCVVIQPEVVHPNRVIHKVPQEVCDVGIKQGKVCVEIEKIPSQKICPTGSEDRHGNCVSTSPVIAPEPVTVTQPAQYVCSDGSAAVGKSCLNREVVPAESICRDGGVKEGSRCVHTADLIYPPARISHISARPVCPQGYQQQGDRCSLTTSEPAELQCPVNFVRYSNGAQECARPHARIPVCPAGTQQTEGGCLKKSYTPPRVTEIKVCTKGQPGC